MAARAFSAMRRGSRKGGKERPERRLGSRSGRVPARVSPSRSRYPWRELVRASERSPWLAPQWLSTSSSMRRGATKPILSRTMSLAPAFSRSSESGRLSEVIDFSYMVRLSVVTQTLPEFFDDHPIAPAR